MTLQSDPRVLSPIEDMRASSPRRSSITLTVSGRTSDGYSLTEEDAMTIAKNFLRQQGYPDYTCSVVVRMSTIVERADLRVFSCDDDIRKAIMTDVIDKIHPPK
jgi:hypothetical protein